jgi:uncharacterized phage protein (TIGR01671 family)
MISEPLFVNSLGVVHPPLGSFVLMQSTGLLDKAGTEIFEGDIVRNLHSGKVYPIQWEFGYCDGMLEYVGWLFGDNEACEVIGNIYENPGLIK